jgi:hypothetical protein
MVAAVTLAAHVPQAAASAVESARAADGTASTITVSALPEGNPRFVDAVYKDLLGRASDAGGRNYWLGRMGRGLSRSGLTSEVARSSEWRRKVIERLYVTAIDRAPTTSETSAGVTRLQKGALVADLAASVYGGATFYGKAGSTGAGFSRRLYQRVVRREPTASETAKVVADLARGQSRAVVARALFLSLPATSVRVDDLYALLLVRNPDPSGRSYWAKKLTTRDDTVVAASLVSSDEYFRRAQKRVASGSFAKPATTEIVPAASVTSVTGGGSGSGQAVIAASVPADLGDVIVIQPSTKAPDGLMGKVTERTADGSGRTVVSTTPVRWNEAFTSADFKGVIDVPARPSAPVSADPAPESGADAGPCLGQLSINPSFGVSYDVELQWGPFKEDILRFVQHVNLGARVESNATSDLECGQNVKWYETFVTLGPIVLDLEASLDVGAAIDGSITGYATGNMFCSLGAEYRDGDIQNLSGCTPKFTAGINNTDEPFTAELAAHLYGRLTAKAYGVVGISGYLGPELSLSATDCGQPWWAAKVKIQAGLDVVLDLWLAEAELNVAEATLFEDTIVDGGSWPCAIGKPTGIIDVTSSYQWVPNIPVGIYTGGSGSEHYTINQTTTGTYLSITSQEQGSGTGCQNKPVSWTYNRNSTEFLNGKYLVSKDQAVYAWLTSLRLALATAGTYQTQGAGACNGTGTKETFVWDPACHYWMSAFNLGRFSTESGSYTVPVVPPDESVASSNLSCLADDGGAGGDYNFATGTIAVKWRLTTSPDNDADGYPNATDPNPSVFNPL